MTKGEENKKKYLKPPTKEEVESFVASVGVSDCQFERFFGMPATTIAWVRNGRRSLPARFWHIVYEKTIPSYGTSVKEGKKPLTFSLTKKRKKTPAKPPKRDIDDNLLDKFG